MNYNECMQMLEQIKDRRLAAIRIVKEIKAAEEEYGALQSSFQFSEMRSCPTHSPHSAVESVLLRVEKRKERLAKRLDSIYVMEDKLSESLSELPDMEQNIIIGFYIDDMTHYELAGELGYSDENVRKIKYRAIRNLSKIL